MIVPFLYSLRPRWFVVALAALTMACANPHDPAPADREHGLILIPILSSLSLISPASAKVGVPFNVTIRTFGSSTCNLPAGLDVKYSTGEVLFTPWVTTSAGAICTDDLTSHAQQASVTIAQPGTVRLVVYGYKQDFAGAKSLGTVAVSINVAP